MILYIGADVPAFLGEIPLWAGMVINGLVGDFAFTVVHPHCHVQDRIALG